MNGPDHFRESVRLLADASQDDYEYRPPGEKSDMISAAQTHALLAQTAYLHDSKMGLNMIEWEKVTGGSNAKD